MAIKAGKQTLPPTTSPPEQSPRVYALGGHTSRIFGPCTPQESLDLETLTSLNREVRPFFLGDDSIWSYPSVCPLAVTAFGGPDGYFILALRSYQLEHFSPLPPNTSIAGFKEVPVCKGGYFCLKSYLL